MRIEIIPCLQDNYSYLVIDEKKNNACVIDPGESVKDMSSKDKRYCVLSYDNKSFYCTDRNEAITGYGRIINNNKFYLKSNDLNSR